MTETNGPVLETEHERTIYSEMCTIRDTPIDSGSEYVQLLRNKRVAVVGPARTLIGKGQGYDFIDSHDIVVRFNEAFRQVPIPRKPVHRYRQKGRYLLLQPGHSQGKTRSSNKEGFNAAHSQECAKRQTKYFCCTNNGLSFNRDGSPTGACDKQDRKLAADFTNLLLRHKVNATFRMVHSSSEKIMRWMNGQCGRTGFVAILDILQFDIARLHITGMTFYHGGGHLLAPESANLHPLKNRDGTWARDDKVFGHDSFVELDLMRLLIRCFEKKVEVDGVLSALLQERSH